MNKLAENLAYGIASIRMAEERRRSQEDLRAYASRLEIINRELQDFAFVAAHDLQEPLRKIQTFCDLAVTRSASTVDGVARNYLDKVVHSAGRMRELLRGLLAFSQVAAKPDSCRELNLVGIVREAANVFEASFKETGGGVEIEDLPVVEADANQILLLFQNLIGNAIKFSGSEPPHIRVYSQMGKQGTCEIFVEDSGIGFEKEYAELIFRPFQRLHDRKKYEGTGIGLAICRKIVERHGGAIRAESEPGKGSTFIISLPVKQTGLEEK